MALSQGFSWLRPAAHSTTSSLDALLSSEPYLTRAHTCTTQSIKLWSTRYDLGCTRTKPDERSAMCSCTAPELHVM